MTNDLLPDESDVMDESEAKRIVSVWSGAVELPTFRDIQQWSFNRKGGYGTVFDATKKFKLPARVITAIVKAQGDYPYFYIEGEGPHSKYMEFKHDGE